MNSRVLVLIWMNWFVCISLRHYSSIVDNGHTVFPKVMEYFLVCGIYWQNGPIRQSKVISDVIIIDPKKSSCLVQSRIRKGRSDAQDTIVFNNHQSPTCKCAITQSSTCTVSARKSQSNLSGFTYVKCFKQTNTQKKKKKKNNNKKTKQYLQLLYEKILDI